ncbi:MAG: flagellar hook-length control protein FliK [Desulfobacterales bacterium]|nr:flagellar hook-length control protein FliK [Desulfobacterales bacterium]
MTPTLSPFETIIGSESGTSGPNRTETLKADSKNRQNSSQTAGSENTPSQDFLATLLTVMAGDGIGDTPSPIPDTASAALARPSFDTDGLLMADEDGQTVEDALLLADLAAMMTEDSVAAANANSVVMDATPAVPETLTLEARGQIDSAQSARTAPLPTGGTETAAVVTDGVEEYGKPAPVLSLTADDSAHGDAPKAAASQAVEPRTLVSALPDSEKTTALADSTSTPTAAEGLSREVEPPVGETGANDDGRQTMPSDMEKPARHGDETVRVTPESMVRAGEETVRVTPESMVRAGEETVRVAPELTGEASKNRFKEDGAGQRHARRADSDEPDRSASEDASVDGEADPFSVAAVEDENETGIKAEETALRSQTGRGSGGRIDPPHPTVKADPIEGGGAERTAAGPHPHAEKASSSPETHHAPAAPRSVQSNMVNQIVDRAVFLQRNGQSEVRMDLKPEHLGRIQMKISTENQRVTVRMLAETPMAREIIEANLGQLRADLASQGLEVDRFDVDMFASDDSGRQDADTLGQRRGPSGAATRRRQAGISTIVPPSLGGPASRTSDRSVDYFA